MKKIKFSVVLLSALLVGCTARVSSEEEPSLSDESISESVSEIESSETLSEDSSSAPIVSSEDISSEDSNSAGQTSDVVGDFPATPVGIEVPSSVFEYYVNVNFSLRGNNLKGELFDKISGHKAFNYSDLPGLMKTTDRDWKLSPDPSESNPYMVLIYGTYNFKTSSAKRHSTQNSVWDREHIWAKSHGNFGNTAPAGTDLHHLRASDKGNNSSRGNLDFGDTNASPSVKDFDGVASGSTGTSSKKSGKVYEPMDIYKGDVARAMFYMATRYSSFNTSGGNAHRNLTLVDTTTSTSTGNGKFGIVSDLLRWHLEDPVDEFEFNRNGLVQAQQNNRNPYIDFPELAAQVFA